MAEIEAIQARRRWLWEQLSTRPLIPTRDELFAGPYATGREVRDDLAFLEALGYVRAWGNGSRRVTVRLRLMPGTPRTAKEAAA